MTVASSRFGDGHEFFHPCRTGVAATAERDLAEDDQWSQSTLRLIVGWRNARVVQKDEPLAGMSQQSGLQCDGLLMTQGTRMSRDTSPARDVSY